MKTAILYVFAGEKAQGAEVVIERLMEYNIKNVDAHLFVSPGKFAANLIAERKPYKITVLENLKKLNRSENSTAGYLWRAIKNYFAVSYQVHRYIIREKIHVVHSNTIVPASYLIPAILYSKIFYRSKKWIWSDHDIKYYSKLEIYLSKICAAVYNTTLVVSNAVKEKYNNNKKIHVLYNGLDCSVFKPDITAREKYRNKLKLSASLIIFGMPAVVHPRKGQLELIEAFNKLTKERTDLHLLLAGGYEDATPEYSKMVKAAIAANNRISHLGFVSKMTDFYDGCDVIINNSDISGSEPLGTTIYEAMSCQKVVLASITGGSPEIITDGVDGFLFESENSSALYSILKYVSDNILELEGMKLAARKKVKLKFSIQGMADHYNKIVSN